MGRIVINYPAPPDSRWGSGVEASMIGQEMPLNIEGVPEGKARVVSAKVQDGGQSMALTLDVEDSVSQRLQPPMDFGFSISS